MTMSDRIAVMNEGHYEQLGDPESLYERPMTRFVAGFLGVSNLLSGILQGSDPTHATIRLPDDSLVRAPRALVGDAAVGATVDIGVRPEKIRLHEPAAELSTGHNRLTGIVRDASYLGVSTQYEIEASGGGRLTVYEQNVERATRAELWARGEAVTMTWAPDHSFVVHAERSEDTARALGRGAEDHETTTKRPVETTASA